MTSLRDTQGHRHQTGSTFDHLVRAPAGLAPCFLLLVAGSCKHESPPAFPPPLVTVAKAMETSALRELHLSGTLEAERSIGLSFGVPGTVEQVLVHEGEHVARGQALARLVATSYANSVGIAKAAADRAEDAHRRLEPMHQNHTLADVKMVEADTGLQQARLALAMARKNLDDTTLRAPEEGIIARRSVEPGAVASPALPSFVLVQTRTVLTSAPVPETQVARLRLGDRARVAVAALGKDYEATVREIGVIADPLTRTYTVKAAVANPTGELRIGMLADLRVAVADGATGVAVPPAAVSIDDAGRHFVFVVKEGSRLERRTVEVGGFAGEGTLLTGGLQSGETIVVSATPMLADGAVVTVSTLAVAAE